MVLIPILVSKLCSTKGGQCSSCFHLPAHKSVPNHSPNFRNKLPLSLELSTSDWLLHMFVCCLLWPERPSLSTFDVRTVSDSKWERRHWWVSQLTYPLFSVIGASSYQTAGNKIIIKDICCGDSTFIIAEARKKRGVGGGGGPSLVHAPPTVS